MSDPRDLYVTVAKGTCECGAPAVALLTSLDGSEPDRLVCAADLGPAERLVLSPAWTAR